MRHCHFLVSFRGATELGDQRNPSPVTGANAGAPDQSSHSNLLLVPHLILDIVAQTETLTESDAINHSGFCERACAVLGFRAIRNNELQQLRCLPTIRAHLAPKQNAYYTTFFRMAAGVQQWSAGRPAKQFRRTSIMTGQMDDFSAMAMR